ncbi:MAG: hypothetical protein IJQ85_02005 [Selenomonadaceae bacterium]|nr:hypothetical protein [Selenomonadaceae bacterium]
MKNYDTQRIIARYQEKPVSISKIAKEFNLCEITVSKLLKKANVPMWTRQDLNVGELKVDYFKEIDTEIKAYLLGLFAADGCVYGINDSKFFAIQLKKDDAEMIKYIKNEINAPRKIVTDKRDGSCGISVVNNLFVQYLVNHGVTEGKSTRFLPALSDHLMSHYVRGLFDGDGSIVIRKAHSYGKAMRCCVVILAHSNLINQLRNYLEDKLNLSHLNFCSNGGEAYSIHYSGRHDFIAVTDFIYKDANLYLKKKHRKYLEALSYLS